VLSRGSWRESERGTAERVDRVREFLVEAGLSIECAAEANGFYRDTVPSFSGGCWEESGRLPVSVQCFDGVVGLLRWEGHSRSRCALRPFVGPKRCRILKISLIVPHHLDYFVSQDKEVVYPEINVFPMCDYIAASY
jgi:hypothetical protein